jgi:hypothetical protein
MSITITCETGDYTTDIELTSETNPSHCPICGGILMICGTGESLFGDDGEYNKILNDENE